MKIHGSMSKKEVRNLYGISATTLLNWIRPILPELEKVPGFNRRAKMYNPRELKVIFEFLGDPE